jgi:hypothetical protein
LSHCSIAARTIAEELAKKGVQFFFSPERKTRKQLASERGKGERGELKLVFESIFSRV